MSSDDKPKFLGHYLESGALTPKPEPLSDTDVIAFMFKLANEQAELVERLKSALYEALIAHVDRARELREILKERVESKDA